MHKSKYEMKEIANLKKRMEQILIIKKSYFIE